MASSHYFIQNRMTGFPGIFLCFCIISAIFMVTHAHANSFYFGAGAGQSTLKPDAAFGNSLQVVDEHDSAYRLFVGYDVLDYLSVEAFYTDLGTAEISSSGGVDNIDYTAFGLEGLAYFPSNLAGFSGFFKLGLGQLESKGGGSVVQQPDDAGLTGGLGVEYQWPGGIFLRADYSVLNARASLASLSLAKRFGKESPLSTQDDDGDGVSNNRDRCPDTQPGERVTDLGCPVPEIMEQPLVSEGDADSDGVDDSDDQCPATLPGSEVDENGCTVIQQFTGVLEGVKFLKDSAELTGQAKSRLNNVAEQLQRFPNIEVTIVGHTDSRATPGYNDSLSLDRARAVTAYLMKKGVSSNRLLFDGRGEQQPLESNMTEAGREKNRRVEIMARELE